jgi:multiple sugar transport system ATP-binding protein
MIRQSTQFFREHGMATVELRSVGKQFGAVRVLQDIDLEVHEGEFLVLVGPSGCGKSTLLRVIAGLDEADEGDVLIGGVRVNDLPPAKRGIAMVFQSYALYPHMTLFENMAFGLRLSGKGKAEVEAAVKDAAELLDIEHLLDRRPKSLSGGQRQRVAIGRAIVRQPSVFLFDEPLSNLDAALRVRMRYEFSRLHKRLRTTTIYVTHDQVEAMTLADRIVILDQGRVQQLGTASDLYERPASKFVAGFIGSPKMNLLGATIDRAGETTTVKLRGEIAVDAAVDARRARTGDPVTLGVRPEHLMLSDAGQGIAASVALIEWLGNMRFAYLTTAVSDEPLIMQVAPDQHLQEGQSVTVSPQPSHCHLFDPDGVAFLRRSNPPGSIAA